MSTDELKWLGDQSQTHERIVEIGSYAGRSTKVLAQTAGIVYAVDNLKGEADRPTDDLDEEFRGHLAEEIAAGKVMVLRMSSMVAADWWQQQFGDLKADMVFIDGDHEHPAPRDDIVAWSALLQKGGLLCGHDRSYPGVARSLYELDVQPEGVAGSIWAV